MTNTLTDSGLRQYLVITGSYWAFTLTDGALRMLVVLYFHQIGYTPLEIALLFMFYEFFGMITNLAGGWLAARIGLNRTMHAGLFLQLIALSMLLVPSEMLALSWVMSAQALSGVAKDLNKLSAKSSLKLLISGGSRGRLYQWVAVLTGSKNTLKGLGFFVGGLLLLWLDFRGAVLVLLCPVFMAMILSLWLLNNDLGKAQSRPKFQDIFSTSDAVNRLSAARFFLFASRDIWFVVALPVYLSQSLHWTHWQVGAFLATWIIGYGATQAIAPAITNRFPRAPASTQLTTWSLALTLSPMLIAIGLSNDLDPTPTLVIGILLFGLLFAINSALHSYLIVSYAREDGVSLDVGFYYMANAAGRLAGTIFSGWIFQAYGLTHCLFLSALLLIVTSILSMSLKEPQRT